MTLAARQRGAMQTNLDLAAPSLKGPLAPSLALRVRVRGILFSWYQFVFEHAGQIVGVLVQRGEEVLKLVWEAAGWAGVHGNSIKKLLRIFPNIFFMVSRHC